MREIPMPQNEAVMVSCPVCGQPFRLDVGPVIQDGQNRRVCSTNCVDPRTADARNNSYT